MPNSFALLALLAWPVVVVVLFRTLSMPKAAAVSIVGGYLLLPKRGGWDLPLLPMYDHMLAAALPALVMIMAMSRPDPLRRAAPPAELLPGWIPKAKLPRFALFVVVASPFFTSMLNNQPLHYGFRTLPALGPYDAASATLGAVTMLLPFFIGRKCLARPNDHVMLLLVLALAGLAYTLPALYEVRMSPQLNRMFYGWAPDWFMSVRRGGWRPSVFLGHGLLVGIFLSISILAALGYARSARSERRWLLLGAALWTFLVLFLCKTVGAFLITFLLAPLILLCGVRLQLMAAAALAVLVLVYPMMRGADLVPTDRIVSAVSAFAGPQRIDSLIFRFDNEDLLLEKARERPLFGWGGWGRNRFFDDEGNDVAITDGAWVITFGVGGWVGYLGQFGLLTLPAILLALQRRRHEVTMATSALCLALVANLIDLVPNSGLTPVTWLLAGALVGRLELRTASAAEPQVEAQGRRELAYRRHLPETLPETAPADPDGPVRARHVAPRYERRVKGGTSHRRVLGQKGE